MCEEVKDLLRDKRDDGQDERVHKRAKEKGEVGGVEIVQVIDSPARVNNRDS